MSKFSSSPVSQGPAIETVCPLKFGLCIRQQLILLLTKSLKTKPTLYTTFYTLRFSDKNYQLGKNLNDQKNTDFQNVLEIDHKGKNFTLKETQDSVKQIIEIQEQETVRMFFSTLRVSSA